MSFQVSPMQALENAGRMMKDGAFESIKLGLQEAIEHAEGHPGPGTRIHRPRPATRNQPIT